MGKKESKKNISYYTEPSFIDALHVAAKEDNKKLTEFIDYEMKEVIRKRNNRIKR